MRVARAPAVPAQGAVYHWAVPPIRGLCHAVCRTDGDWKWNRYAHASGDGGRRVTRRVNSYLPAFLAAGVICLAAAASLLLLRGRPEPAVLATNPA